MTGFSNPIVGGGGALVYPSIHSPNFVHLVSGWTIDKDGSAEFGNLIVRGSFSGTDYVLNNAGAFWYSGTPAAGNLIVAIANAAGADPFGNAYATGISVLAGAIDGGQVNSGTISTAQLAALAVTASKIAANTITTSQIAAAAGILGAQIAAATITGSNLVANTVTAAQIAANTITAAQIAAGTITATQLAANSVTAVKIAAGVITAAKLAAGIIVAGIVDGTTITGGTLIAEGSQGSHLNYSAAPAAGNLVASITGDGIGFTDPVGNDVIPGVVSYDTPGPGQFFAMQLTAAGNSAGEVALWSATTEAGPWTQVGQIQMDGAGNFIFVGSALFFFILAADAIGYPTLTSTAGMLLQVSGSKLANPGGAGTYPITVSNATATSLGFMPVPQGDVELGTTHEIHAAGTFTTVASVPTSATFSVHWGGIAGTGIGSLQIPGAIAASQSGSGWYADAELNWASATEAIVTLRVGWHTATGVVGSAAYFTVSDTTGLVTNSGTKNLTLGFQWGTAPAGTALVCNAFRGGRPA